MSQPEKVTPFPVPTTDSQPPESPTVAANIQKVVDGLMSEAAALHAFDAANEPPEVSELEHAHKRNRHLRDAHRRHRDFVKEMRGYRRQIDDAIKILVNDCNRLDGVIRAGNRHITDLESLVRDVGEKPKRRRKAPAKKPARLNAAGKRVAKAAAKKG